MKKIKGSICAKIAAWIGITLSGILFAGSILGAALMWELGVYEKPRDTMKEEAFQSVSEQYAVKALDSWFNENQTLIDESYFHYGIIKAEKIDGLDLNKDSTYLARNFTKKAAEDDLYLMPYEIGENTNFFYSGTLWGGYYTYNHAQAYSTSQEVYGILYNKEDGIFYYETAATLFPVLHVEAQYAGENYSYNYDFEKKMYRRLSEANGSAVENDINATVSEMEDDVAALEPSISETPYEDLNGILNRDYISFDMLEKAGFSCEMLDWMILDWADDQAWENIKVVDAGYLEGMKVTKETDYYPEGNSLTINHMDEGKTDTYWVVCIKPEAVGTGGSSNLYAQANGIIDTAYDLRYGIYFIMLASVCLGVFCFVFLISAAGHRKGTDEIQEAAIDILPFDIYLVLAAFLEFFLLQMLVELSYNLSGLPEYILMGILVLCICWVALETVLTFAVRIKTKRWWKNTVICRLISGIGKGIRFFVENLPLLGKAVFLAVIVFFVDFITMVLVADAGGIFVLIWLAERVVLAAGILVAVVQMKKLQEGGRKIAEGDLSYQIDAEKMFWDFKEHGENLNRISEGMSRAVDERMKSERFKTELITNVSHDIKTPLTSIINYVDLLEKEELQNETAEEYLEVLERQSGRLKKLIEDLIEASKASSGSLSVQAEKLEAGVFMVQTIGEFEEKTSANGLELIIKKPEDAVYIMADGRHFWRIIDNLMNNICKYAQPSTRVYINMEVKNQQVYITFRNTSRYPLNITSEELMERFVRGDDSRNTEGSGLGISIAKSLTELMGGTFNLYVDGDLFKVELVFPVIV